MVSLRSLTGSRKNLIIFLLVLFIVGLMAFNFVESQPSFCAVCHEMSFNYDSWLSSSHQASVKCLGCHAKPGIQGFFSDKVQSLQEFWVHIIGDYTLPLQAEIGIPDARCLVCHNEIPGKIDADIRHDLHDDLEIACTVCHGRVVHTREGEMLVLSQEGCDSCHNAHDILPLTGGHASLGCKECHTGLRFSDISPVCESCHQASSNHIYGITTECEVCHDASSWTGEVFRHVRIEEHFPSGDEQLPCSSCHRTSLLIATCTGSGCHSSDNPSDD